MSAATDTFSVPAARAGGLPASRPADRASTAVRMRVLRTVVLSVKVGGMDGRKGTHDRADPKGTGPPGLGP
ncbi:hypothetical protein GCM10010344_39750 [Streptomyces bluensis]|nr:hypothetical protein GCM10010344_39750 [Streptomyces bluensis]